MPEYQQTIFIEFSKFSNASQNIVRMPTKYFFQIFNIFERLLKCCQNGNKFFFQNFAKFSSDRQNIVRMATFLFFQIFQNFKCSAKCYQNGNIWPSAENFEMHNVAILVTLCNPFKILENFEKTFSCHSGTILTSSWKFWKILKKNFLTILTNDWKFWKIDKNIFVVILATFYRTVKKLEKFEKYILLSFWQHFSNRLKILKKIFHCYFGNILARVWKFWKKLKKIFSCHFGNISANTWKCWENSVLGVCSQGSLFCLGEVVGWAGGCWLHPSTHNFVFKPITIFSPYHVQNAKLENFIKSFENFLKTFKITFDTLIILLINQKNFYFRFKVKQKKKKIFLDFQKKLENFFKI